MPVVSYGTLWKWIACGCSFLRRYHGIRLEELADVFPVKANYAKKLHHLDKHAKASTIISRLIAAKAPHAPKISTKVPRPRLRRHLLVMLSRIISRHISCVQSKHMHIYIIRGLVFVPPSPSPPPIIAIVSEGSTTGPRPEE